MNLRWQMKNNFIPSFSCAAKILNGHLKWLQIYLLKHCATSEVVKSIKNTIHEKKFCQAPKWCSNFLNLILNMFYVIFLYHFESESNFPITWWFFMSLLYRPLSHTYVLAVYDPHECGPIHSESQLECRLISHWIKFTSGIELPNLAVCIDQIYCIMIK